MVNQPEAICIQSNNTFVSTLVACRLPECHSRKGKQNFLTTSNGWQSGSNFSIVLFDGPVNIKGGPARDRNHMACRIIWYWNNSPFVPTACFKGELTPNNHPQRWHWKQENGHASVNCCCTLHTWKEVSKWAGLMVIRWAMGHINEIWNYVDSRVNQAPELQREHEWSELYFIRNVIGHMIISFYKCYHCMHGLQTPWALMLYLSLTHSWALDCGRGREEREFGWSVEVEGGEREREVNLFHQFEADLFFPAEVTSCWPYLTPSFSPPFRLPHFFPPSSLLTAATVCWSVPCVHVLFVLCVCTCVLARLIFNHFCQCLFRWALWCDPSSSQTPINDCVCPSASWRLERKEGLTLFW